MPESGERKTAPADLLPIASRGRWFLFGLFFAVFTLAGTALATQVPLTIESGARRFQFRVEVADSPQERARGLMFRRELASDAGMLFDFGRPQPVSMWMRNTLIPLDMLFVQADGRISRIVANAEPLSERSIPSGGPVQAVLELKGGVSKLLGLRPGDRVVHPLFGSP